MATNRLEILQNMLPQDPNNTFARYGLAMEYAKSEHYEEAVAEFRTLLVQDAELFSRLLSRRSGAGETWPRRRC